MLQDKVMVSDALAAMKSSLTVYANTISECANPDLRATIQQIRNNDECSQFELYKLAQTKGYYMPAIMANDMEVQQTKSQLQG